MTGVVDVPANSHFRFEILASMATMDIDDDLVPGEDHWQADNGFAYRHIYLLLGEDRKPEGLAQRALEGTKTA